MLMLIALKDADGHASDHEVLLVREIEIPEMVPDYPEGPAYDFFLVVPDTQMMKRLELQEVKAIYKGILGRRDRIFVWTLLRDLGLTGKREKKEAKEAGFKEKIEG